MIGTYGLLSVGLDPSLLPGFHKVTVAGLLRSIHVGVKGFDLLLKVRHATQVVDIVGVLDVHRRHTFWQLTWGSRLNLRCCWPWLSLRLGLGCGSCGCLRSSCWLWLLCSLGLANGRLFSGLGTSSLCGSDLFQGLEGWNDWTQLELFTWHFLKFFNSGRLVDHHCAI